MNHYSYVINELRVPLCSIEGIKYTNTKWKNLLTIQTVPNLNSVSDDQRHVLKDVNVEDLKVCDSEE